MFKQSRSNLKVLNSSSNSALHIFAQPLYLYFKGFCFSFFYFFWWGRGSRGLLLLFFIVQQCSLLAVLCQVFVISLSKLIHTDHFLASVYLPFTVGLSICLCLCLPSCLSHWNILALNFLAILLHNVFGLSFKTFFCPQLQPYQQCPLW